MITHFYEWRVTSHFVMPKVTSPSVSLSSDCSHSKMGRRTLTFPINKYPHLMSIWRACHNSNHFLLPLGIHKSPGVGYGEWSQAPQGLKTMGGAKRPYHGEVSRLSKKKKHKPWTAIELSNLLYTLIVMKVNRKRNRRSPNRNPLELLKNLYKPH